MNRMGMGRSWIGWEWEGHEQDGNGRVMDRIGLGRS